MSNEIDKLREAESILANATTAADLTRAHDLLLTAIRRKRRQMDKASGPLATTYVEAMAIVDKQRAAGATLQEALSGMEASLRAVWPKTRTWNYNCTACNDTGWQMHTCTATNRCDGASSFSYAWNSPMGARRRLCTSDTNYEHDYTTPCHCAKGNDARSAMHRATAGGRRSHDVDEAGATPKRVGRK
jgi:hypothetical protein